MVSTLFIKLKKPVKKSLGQIHDPHINPSCVKVYFKSLLNFGIKKLALISDRVPCKILNILQPPICWSVLEQFSRSVQNSYSTKPILNTSKISNSSLPAAILFKLCCLVSGKNYLKQKNIILANFRQQKRLKIIYALMRMWAHGTMA